MNSLEELFRQLRPDAGIAGQYDGTSAHGQASDWLVNTCKHARHVNIKIRLSKASFFQSKVWPQPCRRTRAPLLRPATGLAMPG